MSSKFSDRQHELLSAAAEREDRLLPIPPHLKGGAAKKVAAKLVAAGLAKEVKAKAGAPDLASRHGDRTGVCAEAHGSRRKGGRG